MDVEVGIGMNINCESDGKKKEVQWFFFSASHDDW
jgi:hypothetical protein